MLQCVAVIKLVEMDLTASRLAMTVGKGKAV